MKDQNDRQTQDFIGVPKMAKFKVNYGYAVKNKLRTGSLILDAKDRATAKDLAVKQLSEEYDWSQINAIIPLDNKNSIA